MASRIPSASETASLLPSPTNVTYETRSRRDAARRNSRGAPNPGLSSPSSPSSPSSSSSSSSSRGGHRDGRKAPQDAAAALLIKLGRSPDRPVVVSPAEDARILRRIDVALLPLMLAVYFLQALDKATLSFASIFGLIEDTGLTGDDFSWLGSIVFLAQLAMQLPIALALVKLPIGKFTSAMVLAWGVTLVGMTWARDFRQLMVSRFLLGAFEACVGPSFVAITQMWWRRREQTMRIGSWYCMNGLTWVVGCLVTYALASVRSSLRPYQIIFLFFGGVTVAVSVVMFYWMPDSPTEARFLSDEDKVLAIERLRDNQMGVMSREWRYPHVREALADGKTWLWVAIIFCISVPSNGISVFGPLIIQSFVTDPFQTMLFTVPIGLSHVVCVSLSAYASMKWKLKGPVIALLCVPPMVGCSILLSFPHDFDHRRILLLGYFCLSTFTGITPLIYAWSAQNTAGDTKKKCTSALVFIGSSAGNIIGPLLYTPEEAPGYSRGLRANLAFFGLIMVLVGVITLYLRRLNWAHARRRVSLGKLAQVTDTSLETAEEAERLQAAEREGLAEDQTTGLRDFVGDDEASGMLHGKGTRAFLDITDLENEDFIFVF